MSAYVDALANRTVRTAIVGGVPTDRAPRSAQEPPQVARPVPGEAVRPRVPEPFPVPDFAPGELVELYGR